MKTEIYLPTTENLEICARLLRGGELVAFPTETVYGLGGNALDKSAAAKIYAAKGRPSDNPLIVHIADKEAVNTLAAIVPEKAKIVMERFMPGPVTIVLPKKEIVPDEVTGGLKTVAVRMPNNPIALALIERAGVPVCAPSANTSTRPSPTSAAHVYGDLCGKIPAILDGGDCEVGVESTVIDFTTDKPRLLRAGGMPIETLESAIGEIEIVRNSKVALCPGMKYKHYSPLAEVFVALPGEGLSSRMKAAYDTLTAEGKKTLIVALDDTAAEMGERNVRVAGKTYADYAHNLFAFLRAADADGYAAVVCEGADERDLGASVANRLIKAAGGKTV